MRYMVLMGRTMNLKKIHNKNIQIFGNTDFRDKNCPSESQEQITFFNEIKTRCPMPYGKIAFHQRNESRRSYRQAAWHKSEGLIKGVPDIIIPGKVTFLCELKRQDHTLCRISDHQLEYLENCRLLGSFCCIALGYKQALLAVNSWIDMFNLK